MAGSGCSTHDEIPMPVEPHSDPGRASTSTAPLVATILGFAIVAIPLAGLTWELLSDIISGHLDRRDAVIGFPAMLLLAIVLWLASRALVRLDAKLGVTENERHR